MIGSRIPLRPLCSYLSVLCVKSLLCASPRTLRLCVILPLRQVYAIASRCRHTSLISAQQHTHPFARSAVPKPAHYKRGYVFTYVPYAPALRRCSLKKASRSALIWDAWVVGMPCGKPGYTFSVAFFSIFADMGPAAAIGTI
jgi:hypothetical protein